MAIYTKFDSRKVYIIGTRVKLIYYYYYMHVFIDWVYSIATITDPDLNFFFFNKVSLFVFRRGE